MYIDMILCRHCRKLLETNHLRDMGYFSANTEDFHLVSFLKRERYIKNLDKVVVHQFYTFSQQHFNEFWYLFTD